MSTSHSSTSRSLSVPSRPPTRRHPFEMPSNVKIRSMSAIVTSRKDVNTPVYYSVDNLYNPKEKHVMLGRFLKEINKFKKTAKGRSGSHELKYRRFILDVMNEIIKKKLMSVDKIYVTFMKHMEANRTILELNQMLDEMKKFCVAVRIPFNENLYQLSVISLNRRSGDHYQLSEYFSPNEKTSLSRLTEYTEPMSLEMEDTSGNLDNASTSSPVSSFASIEVLPGFEILESNETYKRLIKVDNPKYIEASTQKDYFENIEKDCEKCLTQRPVIKINLKNLKLTHEDYLLLDCPVYIPKLIFERGMDGKKISKRQFRTIENIRIDASVSKIGIKKCANKRN